MQPMLLMYRQVNIKKIIKITTQYLSQTMEPMMYSIKTPAPQNKGRGALLPRYDSQRTSAAVNSSRGRSNHFDIVEMSPTLPTNLASKWKKRERERARMVGIYMLTTCDPAFT